MGAAESTAHAPTLELVQAIRAEKLAIDRLSARQFARYRARVAQAFGEHAADAVTPLKRS